MLIEKRWRCHVRCKKCGRRGRCTWQFWQIRKCKWCGGRFRWDKYRDTTENRNPCRCSGYHFLHARGRGFCYDNTSWTEETLRQRIEGY